MKEVIINILSSPLYILLIIVTIALITTIILTIIEIKRRKEKEKSSETETDYSKELKNLKKIKGAAKEKLDKLNILAKQIFRQKYSLSPRLSYYEIMSELNGKNKEDTNNFLEQMASLNYEEKKLNEKEINNLLEQLIKINQKVLINQPKDKIEKTTEEISKKIKFLKGLVEKDRPRIKYEIRKIKQKILPKAQEKTTHKKSKNPPKKKKTNKKGLEEKDNL